MTQKLKFGNGTWATKKGSTLAYNDENDRYKPLPFTTTRDSIATRVNKEGLIEVVGNDVPRIDYTDSEDGALLLEPSATNLVTYSEDFSNGYWIKTEATVTLNTTTSPDGSLNASKLTPSTINSNHKIASGNVSIVSSLTSYWFVKSNGYSKVSLREDAAVGKYASFDLSQGIVLDSSTSSKIEDYGNGWFRIELNDDLTNVTARNSLYVLPDSYISGSPNLVNWSADGTSSIFIWGAQSEEGSYATSYIPTNGSTVTRQADTASGAGNDVVFNDSEGVLFAEVSRIADSTYKRITISSGSYHNSIVLDFHNSNSLISRVYVSGSQVTEMTATGLNIEGINKIAFKYKHNDFSLWANGIEVGASSSGAIPTGLTGASFDLGGDQPFYGKTKELGYYDTALTDAELEYMTSYRSLNELVTELNLNKL